MFIFIVHISCSMFISVSSIFDRVVNTKEAGEAALKKAKTYIGLKKSEQSKPMVSRTSFDKAEVIYIKTQSGYTKTFRRKNCCVLLKYES